MTDLASGVIAIGNHRFRVDGSAVCRDGLNLHCLVSFLASRPVWKFEAFLFLSFTQPVPVLPDLDEW